jgi:hypothetical protein
LVKLARVRLARFSFTDEYRAHHPSVADSPHMGVIVCPTATRFFRSIPGRSPSTASQQSRNCTAS